MGEGGEYEYVCWRVSGECVCVWGGDIYIHTLTQGRHFGGFLISW